MPIFTNVMAPPVAPAQSFDDLGAAVVDMIEAHPADLRVAVIASGHMSNAIGTPQMADFVHHPDNPWDVRVWDEITRGTSRPWSPRAPTKRRPLWAAARPAFSTTSSRSAESVAAGPTSPSGSPACTRRPRFPRVGHRRADAGSGPMSRYATSRVIWEVTREGELAERFPADPAAVLAGGGNSCKASRKS